MRRVLPLGTISDMPLAINDPTARVAIKLWMRNLFISSAFIRPNAIPSIRHNITAIYQGMLVSYRIVASVAPAAVPMYPGERSNSPSRIGKDTATASVIKSTIELSILTMFEMRK
jgi:hypothetical protein